MQAQVDGAFGRRLTWGVTVALMLAACGGGGGSAPAPVGPPPPIVSGTIVPLSAGSSLIASGLRPCFAVTIVPSPSGPGGCVPPSQIGQLLPGHVYVLGVTGL